MLEKEVKRNIRIFKFKLKKFLRNNKKKNRNTKTGG